MTEERKGAFPWLDPVAFARQWGEIVVKSQQAMTTAGEAVTQADMSLPDSAIQAWSRFCQGVATNPQRLAEAYSSSTPDEVSPRDRRFKHEMWQKDPAFKALLDGYLKGAGWLRSLVNNADHLSAADRRRVSFYAEQFIDAMAPTNVWSTNPEVLEKIAATGGLNLLKGFSNFLDDVAASAGHVRRADPEAFEFGVTIAGTKGSVVFRNDLMELIQFEPTTPTVDSVPLLIVPPWVNKYYLFDLQKKSSFIRWAVEQGLTVFVISWANPDQRHADKDFEHYWTEGGLAAIDRVLEATGAPKVNLFCYCLGGTVTAAGLSCMAAQGDDRVASATLVACLTDFEDIGAFEPLIDLQQLETMKRSASQRGYLGSGDLAHLFSLLRANDLIWSSVVSRYLLAEDLLASDMLYWFSDGIGMPVSMLDTFMRKVVLENALAKPGAISFGGTPVDLLKVTTPLCFVSMREDHVAAWESTYRGALRFRSEKRFILGGSGHNAGTINPPAAGRHGYWLNDGEMPPDAADWLAAARRHEGSWWTEWRTWLERFGGEKVPAHPVSEGRLPILEAAPGSYARDRH